MKPKVTFIIFIQLPDLGACFNHVGKSANNVNGKARATAKPNMPTAGPMKLPEVLTSTSKKPIIGPVHEKETSARVNAIRNILNSPLVDEALLSTLLVHEDGKVISNHPKNERAKTTRSKKKRILKTAFVASALRLLAPKMAVIARPRER